MYEIGRLCVKTAGRDAGRKAVIINIISDKFVMIDGETRRRKCNIAHIEALDNVIKIKKDASHEEVKNEFEKLGLKVRETKPKEKTEKPKKLRQMKETKPKEEKKETKEEKKKVVKNKEKKVTKKPKK